MQVSPVGSDPPDPEPLPPDGVGPVVVVVRVEPSERVVVVVVVVLPSLLSVVSVVVVDPDPTPLALVDVVLEVLLLVLDVDGAQTDTPLTVPGNPPDFTQPASVDPAAVVLLDDEHALPEDVYGPYEKLSVPDPTLPVTEPLP